MSKQIFISYRRKDAMLQARLLKMYLMQCGYSVFMDQDDLSSSKPFPDELKNRIRECKDFLLVLTEDVMNHRENGTDFLWEEIYTAYETMQEAKKNGTEPLHMHVVASRNFNKEKFSSDWGVGKYKDAINFVKSLSFLNLLDFDGRDETIVNNFKTEIKDFLSKPEDKLGKNAESLQSGYCVDEIEERRLSKQGDIFYRHDKQELAKLIEKLRSATGEKLNVLDVGCANGETGKKYFGDDEVFGKVIGIDRDQKLINNAWEADRPQRFTYKTLDVCSDNFDEDIKKVKEKAGIKNFDIIFCCQVLHHVAHRNKVIAKLVEHLKVGGCLIIRGSDDGSKMIYQRGMDEENANLINEIISLTNSLPTMADRYYGRKIYFDLEFAGLTGIKVIPITTASSMVSDDKRRDFLIDSYDSSFSWRQYIFDPVPGDSPERKEELAALKEEMCKKLERIKQMLYTSGCWYSVTEYFGYGFKRG